MNFSPEYPLLSAHKLGLIYDHGRTNELEALREVTFQIYEQEFVTLIGPSGSGKSSLLRILAGLELPTSGQLVFHKDQPRIGVVFQQSTLMPWRTVLANITLPLEIEGRPREEIRARGQEMLAMVGLEGFAHSMPRDLSGGMAQRVAIARALISDPDLLLLDEPFAALDALTREQMWDELLKIWQRSRKTVLMVTHSISEALFLSDRVLVLSQRPGHIKQTLRVPFSRPREEAVRYTPEFGQLHQQLKAFIG